jgi:hypothetical protein
MIDKFSSSKLFKFVSMLFLSVLFVTLLLPIINAPLHGDDLISPFNYYLEYDGKLRNYLLNFSLSFDGHFNFLGEIFGALWLDFWISILVQTNSIYQFIMAYRIFKILVMLLFLLLAMKLNRMVFPNLSLGLTGFYTLLSFLIITVYHTNWSSDPVGNYPLTGYLSTSIGVIYIILLQSKKLDNRIYVNLAIIVVAVLYYEINIGLIAVLLYYLKPKLGTKKIVLITIALISIAFCTYSLLLAPNAYSGGQLSLSWKFFYSFFLQIISIVPPITFPLAIYFSKITIVSSLIFCALLFRISRKLVNNLNDSRNIQNTPPKSKKIFTFNNTEKLLLIYFLISCLILALSKKYQNEIVIPGQVYMSYTSGQLLLVVYLTRILIEFYHVRKLSQFWMVVIIALSICFQNYSLVNKLNERSSFSQDILYSWNEPIEERCNAVKNFNSYKLDKSYMENFQVSFSKIFYDIKSEAYCNESKPYAKK